MKKLKIFILASMGLFLFNSCETTDLNLTDNPNALTPDQADIDFFLNDIQVTFGRTVNTFGNFGSELTRLSYMFGGGGNYLTAYSDVSFNGAWASSYSRVMKDIRTMNPLAEEIGLTKHIGVGQVIEAFLMTTLVDYFGDVPYSEAFDEFNLDPALDDDATIYPAILQLLDNAIANFNAESPNLAKDFYYGNDFEKWVKLANTLKMKVYIQTRLVDGGALAAFQQIANSGNYISSNADNFVFEYSSIQVLNEFDARHPGYAANYQATGASDYSSTWLMNYMLTDKSIADPRMRYYFYRQRNSVPTNPSQQQELIRCAVEPIPPHYVAAGAIYCYPGYPNPADGFGYWGRDHGNREGIPPDARLITAPGIYPVGGRFDDASFRGINGIFFGALGAGITPIVLSSTVDFWRAEAALVGGSGNATALAASGIGKSFEYVRSFFDRHADPNPANAIEPSDEPDIADDATYIAEVTANMNAAGNLEQRLDILAKEFFVALYGNGIDAYNFYRRTGAPRDIQPHIEPNPGGFIRSHLYPANAANNNANITQKPNVLQRVFWDNNPETGFPQNN